MYTRFDNLTHRCKDIRLEELDEVVDPRPDDEPKGIEEPWSCVQLDGNAEDVVVVNRNCHVEVLAGIVRDAEEPLSVPLGGLVAGRLCSGRSLCQRLTVENGTRPIAL